ncbi:MAG: M48 family metallopeptidase [Paracoccaceae bacterium]
MKRLAVVAFLAGMVLSGCEPAPESGVYLPDPGYGLPEVPEAAGPPPDAATAARNFVSVVRRMEPAIRQECLALAPPGTDCDFRIVVDDRRDQPPNAYQTVDKAGHPVIFFTIPLIADARNVDELAFIVGHEAAHHIRGHIPRQEGSARLGALILGGVVAMSGGDASAVETAQGLGATVGARVYSQDHELEADELGTAIAWHAGYDPLRGAAFFTRIPDPGNRFLGSHPPNADRTLIVRRTFAELGAAG